MLAPKLLQTSDGTFPQDPRTHQHRHQEHQRQLLPDIQKRRLFQKLPQPQFVLRYDQGRGETQSSVVLPQGIVAVSLPILLGECQEINLGLALEGFPNILTSLRKFPPQRLQVPSVSIRALATKS